MTSFKDLDIEGTVERCIYCNTPTTGSDGHGKAVCLSCFCKRKGISEFNKEIPKEARIVE